MIKKIDYVKIIKDKSYPAMEESINSYIDELPNSYNVVEIRFLDDEFIVAALFIQIN